MKKIIITESQFNMLNEQLNSKEDIFNYIKSLPGKFKIQTKHGNYPQKIYPDGLSTALNYNPITKLYLDVLKQQKKTTSIMPIPAQMDPKPYDILNNIIKATENFHIEPNDNSKPTSWMSNMDPEQQRYHENMFVKAVSFNLLSGLLYEDIFNVDFRYGNLHEEVTKLPIPQSPEDIKKIYKIYSEKDGKINVCLFFASTIPIVRIIEPNVLM